MPFTDKDKNKLFSEIRRISDKVVSCGQGTTVTEFDHTLLCAPGNVIVISVVSYSATGVPTISYYNLDGTPYVGPQPTRCSDTLESDAQLICAANIQYLQHIVKADGAPNGQVYYTDITGALVPDPSPFTYGSCDNSSLIADKICLCDNNGGILTQFLRFFTYDPNTNIIVFTGDWLPDLSAQYTPTGIVGLCDNFGTAVQAIQRLTQINGIGSFIRPANNIQSITVIVRRVDSILTPPTITDGVGNIVNLFVGDSLSWSAMGSKTAEPDWLTGTFTVTTNNPGDVITILYVELV